MRTGVVFIGGDAEGWSSCGAGKDGAAAERVEGRLQRAARGGAAEQEDRVWGRECVTPSVLRPKQITKPYREHHVYVIMHVMEGIDNIFVT